MNDGPGVLDLALVVLLLVGFLSPDELGRHLLDLGEFAGILVHEFDCVGSLLQLQTPPR